MTRRLFMPEKRKIVMYCGRTLTLIEYPGLAVTITINSKTDYTLMISSASENEVRKQLEIIVERYRKFTVLGTTWEIHNGIHWISPGHNWPCSHIDMRLLKPVQQIFFANPGP